MGRVVWNKEEYKRDSLRPFLKYLNNITMPKSLRVTNSRAADNYGLKYRDTCEVLNRHGDWDRPKILRTLWRHSDRTSKLMAIKKKDKPPNNVKNLRAIQFLPTAVRQVEQSAMNLKQWLVQKLEKESELYAFLPRKTTTAYVLDWINTVNKNVS